MAINGSHYEGSLGLGHIDGPFKYGLIKNDPSCFPESHVLLLRRTA